MLILYFFLYFIFPSKIIDNAHITKGPAYAHIYRIYENALIGEIVALYNDGFGVKVGNGEVILTEIQPAGKSKMPAINFINGHKDIVGKILK